MADVPVTFSALTMDGLPAVDPHVTVQIREVAPFQRALNTRGGDGVSTVDLGYVLV